MHLKIHIACMGFYFFKNTFGCCIIIVFSTVKRGISAYRTKTQTHGGIGVRIEITGRIHSAYGGIQQTLITGNIHDRFSRLHINFKHLANQVNTQAYGWVVIDMIRGIPFQKAF